MSTALEKLITIVRLVHEAAPDMPILVRLEGPQGAEGWCVDLLLPRRASWAGRPRPSGPGIMETAMVPALGSMSCNTREIGLAEPTARLVVDMLENLQQKVEMPKELAKALAAKKHTPEFGDLPPGERVVGHVPHPYFVGLDLRSRLMQWRAWAAVVAGVDPVTTSDADLRMHVGERIPRHLT